MYTFKLEGYAFKYLDDEIYIFDQISKHLIAIIDIDTFGILLKQKDPIVRRYLNKFSAAMGVNYSERQI